MKKIIGLSLIIILNISIAIFLIFYAMAKFGIIVFGDFSLQDSNLLLTEIIKFYIIASIIIFGVNFLIIKKLLFSKYPLLISLNISFIIFIITLPFAYQERINFLKNQRNNTFEIDYSKIKKINIENLKTKKTFHIKNDDLENLWKIESAINYGYSHYFIDYSKVEKYKIELIFKNGKLVFTSELESLEKNK
jgi:hypothetical protein